MASAYLLFRHGFDRVVIVITNHSHDDMGDLYVGPGLCSTVEDVSIPARMHACYHTHLNNSSCKQYFHLLWHPLFGRNLALSF